MTDIRLERTRTPRPRPADADLGFGRHFTDHLFRVDWTPEAGWHGAAVVPYGDLAADPALSALHYGQSIFDGLKAYRREGGGLALFRPRVHAERFAASARRLAMPPLPPELLLEGARALLREDAGWMPRSPGTALYLRPVQFATEAFLGVRASRSYTVLLFASPVGSYFAEARPLRLWAERIRSRAAPGGLGAAKAAANYVASLLPAEEAKQRGFDQVLWLDAVEHRWLEEIGTMNVFVRIAGTLVTPPLGGTILAGVTRDSILTLARARGLAAEERPIALDELARAHGEGQLTELFGTGTAGVIAPIGELCWEEGALRLPPPQVALALREELTAIQHGEAPDRHGWVERV
jgi:branched-chain amino acid aminotransferase